MGDLSAHFDRKEFACKDGCGLDSVHPDLVTALERLRNEYGKPLVIHSGLRCAAWNKANGGKPDSGHMDGTEADIECLTSYERYALKAICYKWRLFPRLGNGDTFLHVGVSKTLPQDVEWNY